MSVKDDGKQNTQSTKVLQLGFNISVQGDPGTDFQIVLDDSGQKALPSTSHDETNLSLGILQKNDSKTETSKKKIEADTQEVECTDDASIKLKSSVDTSPKLGQKFESSSSKESSIINDIKSTLEHFEKFSGHLKDVPRLRSHPTATSTPLSDKNNSKSESNLIYPEFRHKRFSHLYDYHYRKNYYFNDSPKPPDLFLKPLPGENLYRSGFYNKYNPDFLRHYMSDSSLNKSSENKAVCKKSKYETLIVDTPGILKKPDSESGDKQSTSSAESIKDIKIYQSGGILIMQNFKENADAVQKKEISSFSAKLIENCNKLREEVNSFQKDNVKGVGFSFEEGKNSGKVVQFDLSDSENQKSRSGDSSISVSKDEKFLLKQASSDSINDLTRNKDSPPQGLSQCQDFPSLSTVENESTVSNQLGMSPTYSSSKKLEWDSGADVGYYPSDPSKENLSTIEKYVLSHLSSGTHNNNFVDKGLELDLSKFGQIRLASEKSVGDIREDKIKEHQEVVVINTRGNEKNEYCNHELEGEISDGKSVKNTEDRTLKERRNLKPEKEILVQRHLKSKPKIVESIDKSVNVNTLFENEYLKPSHHTITPEDTKKINLSNKKSPKCRRFKKSKPSPTKITRAFQKRRFSLESLSKNYDLPNSEMGISKSYTKVVGNSGMRDVELSREVEEIVIDQRFKIKQNVSSAKEIVKPSSAPHEKENKPKRPVSGSSSSNNTVLPNVGSKETEKKETLPGNKFSDQIIQTVDKDCESVGVQAFESQKSSECNSRKEDGGPEEPEKAENVHISFKNVQAFGLNASLPKELAHPKETNFSGNQHTKSTQFFGGPINSLPNYHSSPVTKPKESCSRVPKVLNTKKDVEAEIIRLYEENQKNILANDSKKTNSRSSSAKNKENLFSKSSKRSHSSASQKTKDESEKKSTGSLHSKSKKCSSLMEDPNDVHTSDEVSSKVLTSEVLKEHGDSIDRTIIQEKYFQSQLMELKKREMISRSTAMDPQSEKECVNVGCQYSSRSKDTTSEEEVHDRVHEDDVIEKSKQKTQRSETTDQYDSSQNIVEELGNSKSTNHGQTTGESLPSSTQTAHSWIPGVRNPEPDISGVGRARSFEYLPGHIYESSGNLREELPSETEQNLITSSSSESDSGTHSINKGPKDSEGRNTLVLENSTDNSHESDQLKILDENLTQLNLVVSKLWEKETEVKNLNESFFLNLLHNNGSGDYIGQANTLQPEVMMRKNFQELSVKSDDITREIGEHGKKKTKEISTACQTEEKSSSDSENFYDKRKVLEKKISEEKQNQIKWIENEIHHLNVLRGLLEKQSLSHQKNKDSFGSVTPIDITKKTEIPNNDLNEKYSGPVTPVYGCTISLARNSPPVENYPVSEGSTSRDSQEHGNADINPDPLLYGMSVTLRNVAVDALKNLHRVVMLPVGVQISLKGSGGECSNSEGESGKSAKTNVQSSQSSAGGNSPLETSVPYRHTRVPQNDVHTQFPSSRKDSMNLPSISVQTDFSSGKCNQCRRKSCFCLSLSDRSLRSISRSSKESEKRGSLKCRFGDEEFVVEDKTCSSTDEEFLKLKPCQDPKLSSEVFVKTTSKSSSSRTFTKPRCTNKKKCRNHLERGHSAPVKADVQGIVCRKCESNTASTSDNSADVSSCPCSKVRIQKFSACSCHIIKIMGPKCSSGNFSRQYKKRTSKTTENQSCQTDQVTIVTKELIANPELIKASRAPNVECLSEKKIAVEKKTTVLQKLPNDQRVSFEKRLSYNKKLEVQEKVAVVKKSPEVEVPVKEKSLKFFNCTRQMGGQKKEPNINNTVGMSQNDVPADIKALRTDQTCICFEALREKMAEDDDFQTSGKKTAEDDDNHPRHYFLKIEETEIDDSNESVEMKNSLEVITVKVPVKKAGKSKIYNPKFREPYQTNQYSMNSREEAPQGCSCCRGCKGYGQKSTKFNPSDYRRTLAEKPHSPVKPSSPHPTPVTSSDDIRYPYKYDKYQPFEERSCCIQAACGCGRSTNSQDSAPKRDNQIEYDSHKKYRCYSNSNSYENERHQEKQEKRRNRNFYDEIQPNDVEKLCRPQGGWHHGNDDYYNYDKREYMTRSELLKEEEKKRKTYEPSLQEYLCRNRPDFYNTAEKRRQIITEKARERVVKNDNRMECLLSLMHYCNESNRSGRAGGKQIFRTSEMRGQTLKRYKKLPEVTGKIADQKKKEEYRTNKLVADIYSKKLQIEALKGRVNLSNSISVLATI